MASLEVQLVEELYKQLIKEVAVEMFRAGMEFQKNYPDTANVSVDEVQKLDDKLFVIN